MSFDGDERPEEEEEEDHEANFQFFLELAKPLVLELPSSEDKALAAAWVTRLEAEPQTDEEKSLRVDYLKLLLFVMQRGRLIGIFKNEPPEEPLQPFPQGLGLAEMGNLLLEQSELQGSGDTNAASVSYSVEISNDLKEFVAAQEIPDFGVQLYYAWSTEDPIHKWSSYDEKKFPQYVRDKIRQLKVMNSEEKTNVQASTQGDNTMRKVCDSSAYDKTKAKVKSPQEIERSLQRSRHTSGAASLQGGWKEDDKGSPSRKKSRSSSKRSSPVGSLRKTDQDFSRFCGKGLRKYSESNHESVKNSVSHFFPSAADYVENGCGCNNLEASAGGMKGRGKGKPAGCGCCGQQYRKQERESSKQLQKCDIVGENGGTFVNEPSATAASGQRNSDRYGGEMYAENQRCIGENVGREKPICPAARLYLMNQAPLIKSRKTKCAAPGNTSQQQVAHEVSDPCLQSNRQSGKKSFAEDAGKKCNYGKQGPGKTCSAPPSAVPPCTCSCPREEKEPRESAYSKKKPSPEKSCSKVSKTICPETSQRRPQPLDAMDDGQISSRKMPFQMPFANVIHVEGCTCLDTPPPPRRLEGLNRLGLGETTPDSCIVDEKPQRQQSSSGRRKDGEKPEKRQQLPCQQPYNQQEDVVPAPCLKTRPRQEQLCEANRKTNSCPPPRTKPSNMNAPCGERAFQVKGCETDVKNLQYTPNQQQERGEALTARKRQFGNETYGKEEKSVQGLNQSWLQELISPITPREFVDVLSTTSSAEEPPCVLYRGDGQDEAANVRGSANDKYVESAGEYDEDEDPGAGTGGYSSSSDAGNAGPGQNFDDYEVNECQKGSPRRRPYSEPPETQGGAQVPNRMTGPPFAFPYNPANGPGPTQFNPPPQNQPFHLFPPPFGGGNAPWAPYNTGNYNQQPYSMPFDGGNPFSLPQGGYNQPPPGAFPMSYGSYNPPQATFSQMSPGQMFAIPSGARNQQGMNSYGPPQEGYKSSSGQQQFLQSDACGAPPRQRQSPDTRSSDMSRRGMSDYPQSFLGNYQMSMISTPYNASSQPPPPNFPLSPIVDSPASQGMRFGPTTPYLRSQNTSGGGYPEISREWVTLKSARRSMMGKSCNRIADQSSEMGRDIEPDSLMQTETTNSTVGGQYGSYEESPKWRELPKSTRFQRNLGNGSCYK